MWRQALLGHCEAWSAKFTGLLSALAARELADLQQGMAAATAQMLEPLTTPRQVQPRLALPLDTGPDCCVCLGQGVRVSCLAVGSMQVAAAAQLLERLQAERPGTEARMQELSARYEALTCFEVQPSHAWTRPRTHDDSCVGHNARCARIPPEVRSRIVGCPQQVAVTAAETAQLEALPAAWAAYAGAQEQAASALQDARAALQEELAARLEGFKEGAQQAREAYQGDAPHTVEVARCSLLLHLAAEPLSSPLGLCGLLLRVV